jgi:4'-phosphopantetheinyl transferase
MDQLPVRWWADGRFVAPAGERAAPSSICIVGVRGQPDRATARRTIRAALLDALAQAAGVPPTSIRLCGAPGEAPYALLDAGRGASTRIAVSISHDGDVSVAALRLDGGAVGIDVMRVADIPDWHAVAHDYLGPACAAALSRLPAAPRAVAFARAWAGREARFKCLGSPLAEWRADEDAPLAAFACLPLALPAGYVGTVALPG